MIHCLIDNVLQHNCPGSANSNDMNDPAGVWDRLGVIFILSVRSTETGSSATYRFCMNTSTAGLLVSFHSSQLLESDTV